MTDGTTSTSTIFAGEAQVVEHPFRKGTEAGSIPVVGSIFVILLAIVLACVPANYAKDLDTCAFKYAPNHAAVVACQCDVAQHYGRDCGFLQADAAVVSADGAASQDAASKE